MKIQTTGKKNTVTSNTVTRNASTRISAAIAIIALTVAGLSANANAGRQHRDYDYAKVSSVEPIYQTVSHRVPIEQCRIETVRVRHDRGYQSSTGTIVGGIVGAAIGNRLGHKKRNKQVGAIAGAILGASIGSDISAKNRHHTDSRSEYRDVERCSTYYETEQEQRLVGYDVAYRYHGRTHHTRTDRHPGKRIRVSVTVRPAF